MKALLIATTLLFSSAAMAQDSGQPMQSDTTAPMEAAPAPDNMPPPPAGSDMSQPGAPMPAADGPMAAPAPMASAPMASDPSSYPPCTRTLKDKCTNRGGR